MTLNLSCHLEMLALERAVSIGTCGLVESVRIVGWREEVMDCQNSRGCLVSNVPTQFQRAIGGSEAVWGYCTCGDITGRAQGDILFDNFLRLRRGSGMLAVEYHHGGEASVTPDTLSKASMV